MKILREQSIFLLVFFCNFSVIFAAYHINDTELKYGLWADCPGSEKPAAIKPESLKHLSVRVEGRWFRTKYNYYEMRNLATDPNIDFRRKTVVFSVGYMSSPDFVIARFMGPRYRDLDYNVILLDTMRFMLNFYAMTPRFMRTAGFHTAEMLVELTKHGLDPKRLELIGVSLGAQIVSFVAKSFKELTGVKVSRLTGLDPSGPCFRNLGPDSRIDKEDADFVDIVSTNINGFGMAAPVGHVNFYVNGGDNQPGDIFWLLCNVYCSHVRSFNLWLSVLKNPRSFIAIKCDSVKQARLHQCYDRVPRVTNVMGLEVDKNKTGIFYLASTNNYPYFLGKKGLLKENQFFAAHLGGFNKEDLVII